MRNSPERKPPKQEKISTPSGTKRMIEAWVVAASAALAAVGGGYVGADWVGKKVPEWTLGARGLSLEQKKLLDEKIEEVKKTLENLQKRKEGLGWLDLGLPKFWWKRLTEDPEKWLRENRGVLEAQIKALEAKKAAGDIKESIRDAADLVIYVLVFAFVFYESVPKIYWATSSLLKGKLRLSKDKEIIKAINDIQKELDDLKDKAEKQLNALQKVSSELLTLLKAPEAVQGEELEKVKRESVVALEEANKTLEELRKIADNAAKLDIGE